MGNKMEELRGLDELLSFLTRFLASPDYVKNPYLRAKIVCDDTMTLNGQVNLANITLTGGAAAVANA